MSETPAADAAPHYLQAELEALVRRDDVVLRWLDAGVLDGIWYWDLLDPEHEWMSPEFWRTFGHDPSTKPHLASAWQDMIHPDDLKTAVANLEAHLADPDVPYDQVVRYRHRDGSTVWVRCRGLAIRGEDGQPRRLLGAHTDVTVMKRTELELAASNASLVEMNADLKEFAYAASHDLKSPIRTMRGMLTILREDHGAVLDDDARSLIDMIDGAAIRMQELTESVLDLAHSAGGTLDLEVVDFAAVFREVRADLGADLDDGGGAMTCGELPHVLGSAMRLRRLLQNLVENSLRFRSPDTPPRIHLAVTGRPGVPDPPAALLPDRERVEFTLTDNGIGVKDGFAEEIFAPFRRLHGREAYPGIGLGLTLCRRVVTRHGGTIEARPNPPRGLAVSFTLPLA